ncbi:MAG: hypothetical protein ACK57G_11240, partial [Planctomycetota bacterium]
LAIASFLESHAYEKTFAGRTHERERSLVQGLVELRRLRDLKNRAATPAYSPRTEQGCIATQESATSRTWNIKSRLHFLHSDQRNVIIRFEGDRELLAARRAYA